MSLYDGLLRLTAMIRHRSDTVDANGDVATAETVTGPHPCHAYQRYRYEDTADTHNLGIDELVVHFLPDVEITTGDLIDITWPDGQQKHAEVLGPPAYRVRARSGAVHHVELRTREIA